MGSEIWNIFVNLSPGQNAIFNMSNVSTYIATVVNNTIIVKHKKYSYMHIHTRCNYIHSVYTATCS